MSEHYYYLGVDVGTGSARASLVDAGGQFKASHIEDIQTWRDPTDHRIFEQSTDNIWSAIATAIKTCLSQSNIPPSSIRGIGFAATCSLAVLNNDNDQPLIVTKGPDIGNPGERNVILWADHRAENEADLINASGAEILRYVGGKMSLEMEVPKILWLRNNTSPSKFSKSQFFDLPDFLTYRASRRNIRSCCSLTAKFLPDLSKPDEFFKLIGLEEVIEQEFRQVGFPTDKTAVSYAGLPVGKMDVKAAEEFGLESSTVVASSLIDAYGGWVGTVGARYTEDGKLSASPSLEEAEHRLAMVAGTSTCHLVLSKNSVFVPGVWGPYRNAVFRDFWMNEGGQSSTGQLIDFIITTHPAYDILVEQGKEQNKSIFIVLQELLETLRKKEGVESLTELTRDLHFYPDLHGNRSPIADSQMRGSFVGLTLDNSLTDLALKYNVTLESISLQNRHIIEEMNVAGHSITSIYMSGGQSKNIALMQLFANTCNLPVVLPHSHSGAVVLGAAILGRFAAEVAKVGRELGSGEQTQLLWGIMVEMTPPGSLLRPTVSDREKKLLDAKYKIFRETIEIQKRWRKEMAAACA